MLSLPPREIWNDESDFPDPNKIPPEGKASLLFFFFSIGTFQDIGGTSKMISGNIIPFRLRVYRLDVNRHAKINRQRKPHLHTESKHMYNLVKETMHLALYTISLFLSVYKYNSFILFSAMCRIFEVQSWFVSDFH